MAADIFLKLEGLEGESTVEKHEGEIEVLSWSWGAHQTATGHSGGGSGAGKVNVHDLTITKGVDKSSPNLFGSCSSGKHIPKGVLTVRKAGGDAPLEYVKIHLEQILISSYTTGSHGQELVTETVALNFSKVKFEYAPQKPDGSGGPTIIKGWDIGIHKEWS